MLGKSLEKASPMKEFQDEGGPPKAARPLFEGGRRPPRQGPPQRGLLAFGPQLKYFVSSTAPAWAEPSSGTSSSAENPQRAVSVSEPGVLVQCEHPGCSETLETRPCGWCQAPRCRTHRYPLSRRFHTADSRILCGRCQIRAIALASVSESDSD